MLFERMDVKLACDVRVTELDTDKQYVLVALVLKEEPDENETLGEAEATDTEGLEEELKVTLNVRVRVKITLELAEKVPTGENVSISDTVACAGHCSSRPLL